jgi:hypothetical protein
VFGVNTPITVTDRRIRWLEPQQEVTDSLGCIARVAIRPRKMTGRADSGPNFSRTAQNAVTSWCQRLLDCDKTLCLYYETPNIHDFGSKSCSSWIHQSHFIPENLASY